jgi:glyoxylase-like metal-dependent hydrolase (beta-lactamase superfamily II)
MNIYTIPLGVTRCYLVQDKGVILIDGGTPGKLSLFLNFIKKHSINPKQVTLIVQTHGHWDHIGSTKAIKEVTGAQIAMHKPDKEWLEKSSNQLPPLPPGVTNWGRVLMKLMSGNYMRSVKLTATNVDIELQDSEFSLTSFGIPGKVVYTPGHSPGSVSVLLDTGDAFVGDLTMNGMPFGFSPCLPVFAEDPKKVRESCKLLLDMGAKKFYPGHGNPFSSDVVRKLLNC